MKKALLLIIGSMLFIWTLSATPTNVIGEVFASPGCPHCPAAQSGLEQLYDGHPNVIPILWYSGSSPAYSTRGSFYGFQYIPQAQFNGSIGDTGGGNAYSRYLSIYNQIITRVSPLEMTSSLNIVNDNLVVTTNVEVTGTFAQTNNKLVTVLTKHTPGSLRFLGVTYDQQEFDLNAVGQTQEYSATFTLDPSWDLQDIKAVSFVQTWTGNKIILQACQTGFSGLMALFASDVTSGVRDLTVNFNDFSFPQDGVLEWQWDFDGDGVIDSYEQYPSYTYTEPGIYSNTNYIRREETHTATTIYITVTYR